MGAVVGLVVGAADGAAVGAVVGAAVTLVGDDVIIGVEVGLVPAFQTVCGGGVPVEVPDPDADVGADDGRAVGLAVGAVDGESDGCGVGAVDGESDG